MKENISDIARESEVPIALEFDVKAGERLASEQVVHNARGIRVMCPIMERGQLAGRVLVVIELLFEEKRVGRVLGPNWES